MVRFGAISFSHKRGAYKSCKLRVCGNLGYFWTHISGYFLFMDLNGAWVWKGWRNLKKKGEKSVLFWGVRMSAVEPHCVEQESLVGGSSGRGHLTCL